MLNENIIVAIIASAAPTLAVLGTTYVSLKTMKEQNKKQDTKLDEIHEVTNSNFSKALEKIDRLEKVIKGNAREKLRRAERK